MNERKVAENIRKVVGAIGFDSVLCTVESVEGATCTVKTILSEVIFEGVRLAADTRNSPALLITPKVGSVVVVTSIDKLNRFVSLFSEAQSIVFNGGDIGGMVKAKELVAQLDKVSKRIDAIVDALSQSATGVQDGGAAYKAGIVAKLSGLAKEDFKDIENPLIMH